jgi:hypothetical protein
LFIFLHNAYNLNDMQYLGKSKQVLGCSIMLASSAEFSELWRPQLHVVGTIAWGHIESYFIMDCDLAKDANMECTVISRTLDLVTNKMGDGANVSLPTTLLVAADNTPREGKNQHFQTYLAYLKASGKFESAEAEYLRTGHTHNEQDQRFHPIDSN